MQTIQLGDFTFSYLQLVITGVFNLMLIVQLFYFLFFYMRAFSLTKKKDDQSNLPPVSIVICARNEETNIKTFLPEVLKQNYPKYEVIVVDDCSTDGTGTILAKMKTEYDHLYFTQISGDKIFGHNKKLAVTIGMKAARYEIVVHTDADCLPNSRDWLREIIAQFDENTDFVLGYGPYEAHSGLLNFFIRYDTALIGLRYLSFAMAGFPYMGVGRNLAYRKKMFFEGRGFENHSHIGSGDDDLLVNKLAHKKNTQICVSNNSFTHSVPKMSWKEWKRQKQRHFTTAPHYRFIHKFLLGLEPLTKFLFYVSFVASLFFFPTFVYYFVAAFALRSFLQILTYQQAFKVFGEKHLFWGIIFLDVILPIIYIWLGWSRKKNTRKQSSWM